MALHFSKKLNVPLDPRSKARSFTLMKTSTSKKSTIEVLVSFHGNSVALYSLKPKKGAEEEKEPFTLKQTYGQLECHKTPVRGVVVSSNDSVFVTNSFDSVKAWSVDLYMY